MNLAPSDASGKLANVDAAPESRIGGTLCSGMPWLPPEHLESPQGMLERPPGCETPLPCARDRVCWAAKRRELGAHERHGDFLRVESGVVVTVTPIDVTKRKTVVVIDEEFAPEEAA